MSDIAVSTAIELNGLERRLLNVAEKVAPARIARALNRTGAPTQTAYLRQVRQTLGLRPHRFAKAPVGSIVRRYTSPKRATGSRLVYSLAGFGKGLPAIYFAPKEAPSGGSINWLGTRKAIPRSFFLGGRFPRRKRSRISHVVWQRTGKGKWTLDRVSGPGLPEAMAENRPRSVWEGQAGRRLPVELRRVLQDLLRGF